MNFVQPTRQQFNDFVLSSGGSFQQSWQWGELQERMGRPVKRFLEKDWAATFVRHDLKLGKYYWLCPRGPVIARNVIASDSKAIPNLLRDCFVVRLRRTPRNDKNCIFMRIEPEEPINRHVTGLIKAPKDHNPRATIILDLTKSEEELLAGMHSKTRYNINLAKKKGLVFKNWIPASAGMTDFLGLLEKTAKRDKFFLHPRKYYESLAAMPEIKLFSVEHGGRLLAAAMVSFWGNRATYLHGASDYDYRALMAPFLLHWEIIRQSKASGLHYYDFGGVAPKDEPNHFLAGVTRFKLGFGGEYKEYAGSWDYVLQPGWYKIYKLARRVL